MSKKWWWSDQIEEKVQEKKQKYLKWLSSKQPADYDLYKAVRNETYR